jgi:NAD(P)-dependent dehydrogenase (short-subunit alcohol dehydrogenase family)
MNDRLAGRRGIVTGAASGIGRAALALFRAEGARVLGVDLPGKAIEGEALNVDLADPAAAQQVIDRAAGAFGGLDILYNNAGVGASTLAADMTDAAWSRVIDVNLSATFRLCRAAIPHLIQSACGRIINTASVMAEGTDYGLSAYAAAKAGIAGLTRTLALELGKHAVTANYLLPGAIRTGMTSPLWDVRPEVAEIWAKKAALRRLGAPEDIARAALFLASADSGFVTGHGLVVDGGLTLRI